MDNDNKVVTTKETTVEKHVESPTVVEKRTVVEEKPKPKPHETVTIETHTEG